IRLALFRAASRMTFAPFRSARSMAFRPSRSGSLRSLALMASAPWICSNAMRRNPCVRGIPRLGFPMKTDNPAPLRWVAALHVELVGLDSLGPQVLKVVPSTALALDVLDESLVAPLGGRGAFRHVSR